MHSDKGAAGTASERQPVALIIDDESSARFTLMALLEHVGFRVRSAADGVSGLQLFRESLPDLVVTDMLMPGVNGAEVIVSMRRERPDAKIVAISGYSWIDHLDFLSIAQGLGASAILRKPFDVAEVESVCRALYPRAGENTDCSAAATSFDRYAENLATETARRLEIVERRGDARTHDQWSCKPREH
jgi:DNA-binding response OmpR family regulator